MRKAIFLIMTMLLFVCVICFRACAEGKESLLSPNVGSIVQFGHYEQDNDSTNGKEVIEWIVLDVQDDKVFLLSKYGLDNMDYGKQNSNITWEKSIIRTWLNKTFLNEAFSAQEQKAILTTNVDNSKKQCNSAWKAKGGKNTKDKLFLLSYHEAFEVYFSNDDERLCAPTDYVDPYNYRRGILTRSAKVDGRAAYIWWLRSPGMKQNLVVNVSEQGEWVVSSSTPKGTNYLPHMVRPAMWVDLKNELIEIKEDTTKQVFSEGEGVTWFDNGMGVRLPTLQLRSGEQLRYVDLENTDEKFFAHVGNAEIIDYDNYVELLKQYGYTEVLAVDMESYEAKNEDGYKVFAYYADNIGLIITCCAV